MPEKVGVSFSVSGDIRFVSHQDMLQLLIRAIRRSALPIAYSQGHNPRPRLWLMLPKPVAIACCDDLLVVELERSCSVQEFTERLGRHLPVGVKLNQAFRLARGRAPQPTAGVYSLELSRTQAGPMSKRISEVLEHQELFVDRFSRSSGSNRRLDIRPYLSDISLDGVQLSFALAFTPRGSAKPAEVLAALGVDTPLNRAKVVRRKTIYADRTTDESTTAGEQ